MRDCFTPVFLLALALLFLVHGAGLPPFVFRPLALLAFALFLSLFVLKRNRSAYVSLALAFALLLCGAHLERRQAFDEGRDARFPHSDYVTIGGRLAAYPEIGNDLSWMLLRARSFSWRGKALERELTVRVACSGDLRHLDCGDLVEVAARVDGRRPNRNFFPNPYENFLLYKGIHLAAYSKSAQLVRVVERANPFWRVIGAWRGRVRAAIEGRYLENGLLLPPGVFLEATLLGDRGRLENQEQEVLIGSGVFHLLAISGGNIAMLALVALLLCRWLRLPLKPRYAVTSLLLLLYLTVSGFDVSAARAVMMALLLFAGRVWFMEVEVSNVISFCGLLLLAVNPAQFLDPGFILTFALTAAIVAGRRLFLPLLKKAPRWAAELASANVSAALAALPLSLYFFRRYAFSGFFSGLVLAPLAAAVTVCGVLLLLLAWLPLKAATLVLLPAGACLDAFFALSGWIYDHASWNVFRPAPPPALLALATLLCFALCRPRLKPRWRVAAGLLLAGMLLWVALPPPPYRPGDGLEVYFLDVGHGDALVVVFPGGDALLVDGGGANLSDFQVGRRLVLPFLVQKRIRVRWVAVSHCHPDHVKGVNEIIAFLRPEELWISSTASNNPHYQRLIAAKPAKTLLRRVAGGFARKSAGWSVSCLAPPRFIEAEVPVNNHSMVLRLSDGRAAFLLTGDIEKEVEEDLGERLGRGLASSVLKIPHHGSRTSSSDVFLDRVRPRLAVISAPSRSSFGFPHREVVERLKRRGIRWLTTARSGGIMIASTPGGLEIEVSK
ncbi:MAG: DNA internalization-related competence protein ComEC/Rec2 [Candidatus Aminicenantes bacterium]|nr:DNA internalization-related competence protein ComEC/Rec2 [Candidatus Aminicenantes bacterium]